MATSSKSSGPTLSPPLNFAMVEDGVFRSAYPTEANVPFLRHIGIRNVVLLSIEGLPGPVRRALGADCTGKTAANYATRGPIRVIEVADMRTWRVDWMNSGDDFSRRDVMRALDFAVDRQWHPILFACPLGELQTSIMVGCMRRYQHWALSSIYGECELFTKVCRSLRSSLLLLIEAWDPVTFPISATNIQYRNREMLHRDRTRAHQERRRHRRAHAAATLAKSRKADLSDSADDRGSSAESMEGEEEEEDDDEEAAAAAAEASHSGASDVVDRSGLAVDKHVSSPNSSPQQTFSEASGSRTPPSMEFKDGNPEAAFISTSGQRPPMMLRRAAAQRLREQQHQQQHQGGDHRRGTSADKSTLASTTHGAEAAKDAGVQWAEWYLEAMQVGEELKGSTLRSAAALATTGGAAAPSFGDALPPPHVLYAGARNPPALDSRSKFTKESIVEEDDD